MKSDVINFSKLPNCIGIVGSREFPSEKLVRRFVRELKPKTFVISGGAIGVDSWAVNEAEKCRLRWKEFLPDKDLPYPARFFARNTEIVLKVHEESLFEGQKGLIVAFILDPPKTHGTHDTLEKATKQGMGTVAYHMNTKREITKIDYNKYFEPSWIIT